MNKYKLLNGGLPNDPALWEKSFYGKKNGFHGDIRPATSMVEVSRLIDPDMLVEIEAVAVDTCEIS